MNWYDYRPEEILINYLNFFYNYKILLLKKICSTLVNLKWLERYLFYIVSRAFDSTNVLDSRGLKRLWLVR